MQPDVQNCQNWQPRTKQLDEFVNQSWSRKSPTLGVACCFGHSWVMEGVVMIEACPFTGMVQDIRWVGMSSEQAFMGVHTKGLVEVQESCDPKTWAPKKTTVNEWATPVNYPSSYSVSRIGQKMHTLTFVDLLSIFPKQEEQFMTSGWSGRKGLQLSYFSRIPNGSVHAMCAKSKSLRNVRRHFADDIFTCAFVPVCLELWCLKLEKQWRPL